jgi:Lon protease-like protein
VAATIALFPLDYVLLPGVALPLHVFEPRYRQLVADVGPQGSFGVVLGHSGSRAATAPLTPSTRVGDRTIHDPPTEPELAGIGTIAEIIERDALADGRCDLLTAGTKRFRILGVDATTHPYLQAHVEFLDEPAGTDADAALARVRPLCARYAHQLAQLVDQYASDELADEPVCASYEVAARLQLTTADRQGLLAISSAGDRLRAEARLLRRELTLLRTIHAVPVPAEALRLPAGVN